MKTSIKKLLSIILAVSMLASLFVMPASAAEPELDDWETLLDPVYYMDFSPDSDGKFYDSPAGTAGRQEVARIADPEGMADLPGDNGNVDNMILSSGQTGKINALHTTAKLYSAFSKGETAGSLNTGASGATDDYCIKSIDNEWNNSSIAATTINFPQTYGGTGDAYDKYRFEMDWKWQAFTTVTGGYELRDEGSIENAYILRFYIGDKELNIMTKQDTESNDARGAGAIYFQCSDFGLNGTGQTTAAEDVSLVTKSAAKFSEAESGKWIHITVDFDFEKGTINATFEGETETRQIATSITSGKDDFKNGITGFRMIGSTKGARRMNFIDNVMLSPVGRPEVDLSAGEVLGENAYLMDFSPVNGVFYDSPADEADKKEVARIANPADMIQPPKDGGNVDNMVISTDTTGRIYAGQATTNLYSAFSKGQTAGDFNTGASGAIDDYCLKSVDTNAASGSSTANTMIIFPETYGDANDNSHKYRFEMDWKWQSYKTTKINNVSTLVEETVGSLQNATVLRFFIGGKELNFKTSHGTNNLDARGAGAFFFECNDFGLTWSGQMTSTEDTAEVTKTAAALPATESGKWIHITIDFDFEEGIIDATLDGETEIRRISTKITKNDSVFANGITGIRMFGTAGVNIRKVNFIDNITLTPIMTKEPTIKADGNKIMWKAVTGAALYNVYASQTANGEKQAVTVKNLDTTSNPGYVIASLNFADDSAKYYTVTALSANKGESYHSNSISVAPKNIISNVDFEITSAAEGKSTAKATVNVEAAKGFGKKINLMAAVYNSKELISLAESPLTEFSRGTDGKLELTLNDLTAIPTSEMSIKFFIWDEDINPVKKSESLTFTQWREKLENSGHD